MKIIPLLLLFLLASCISDKKRSTNSLSEDEAVIEREIADFHQALKRAYNGVSISTDSLMDNFFEMDVFYVTYW